MNRFHNDALFVASMRRILPLCALLAAVTLASATAHAQVFIDSLSFEDPPYSTSFDGDGKLEGQPPGGVGVFGSEWLKDKTPVGFPEGSALVQGPIAATGSQSVRVDRVSGSQDRWGVSVQGFPSRNFVCIGWDMRVEDSGGAAESGPLFGAESYDDDGPISRHGILTVDSSTGNVLYAADNSGFADSTFDATFGVFHHFDMLLDLASQEISYFFEGTLIDTVAFIDGPGLNEFTDAPILAVPGLDDLKTGTAYFDNYVVAQGDVFVVRDGHVTCFIPEPASAALLLAGFALCGTWRRRSIR